MSERADAPLDAPAHGRGALGMPLSASVGSMLGICGAPIGLFIASLATGTISSLWDETLGLMLVCLAAAALWVLLFAFASDHARRAGDRGLPIVILWGSQLPLIGVLLLLATVWLQPAIEAEPKLVELADTLNAGTGVSLWVCFALIGAGIVVLIKPAYTLLFAKR